jgi:hypothetical protein
MATNTLKVTDLIAKGVISTLHAKGNMINTVDKSRSADYLDRGVKPGESIRIKRDPQFSVTSGRVGSVQNITEETIPVTVGQINAVVEWTSAEKTLSLDGLEKLSMNLGGRLIRQMESDGLQLARDIAQTTGTAGTEPGAMRSFGDGYAKMMSMLAPEDGIYAAITPSAMTALNDSLKGLNNPSDAIANQYMKGRVKYANGINFYQSPSVYRHTAGSQTNSTPLTNQVAAQTGATLAIDGLTTSTATITRGTKFTIDGVYAVDPETKTTQSYLREFTVTEDATGSGSAISALKISPSIVTTGGFQNCSNGAANDKAVTFKNTASAVDSMNLMYQKDAITLVSFPIALPEDTKSSIADFEGIKIRVAFGAFDAINDTQVLRLDAYYAWGVLRQDHCNVVMGD